MIGLRKYYAVIIFEMHTYAYVRIMFLQMYNQLRISQNNRATKGYGYKNGLGRR